MLKSVAFPLSPFVGIPPCARDDDTLVPAYISISLSNRSVDLPILSFTLALRFSSGTPGSSLCSKVRVKLPHPHLRQGRPDDLAGSTLDPHVGSSFCHQVLNICVDMTRERCTFSFRWYDLPLQQSRISTASSPYRERTRFSQESMKKSSLSHR